MNPGRYTTPDGRRSWDFREHRGRMRAFLIYSASGRPSRVPASEAPDQIIAKTGARLVARPCDRCGHLHTGTSQYGPVCARIIAGVTA